MGDFVVVINAQKITVTGTKTHTKLTEKMYHHHSGYPGGLKSINLRDQLQTHPDRVIRSAVWGMLPHNKMGRHPHDAAQSLRWRGTSAHHPESEDRSRKGAGICLFSILKALDAARKASPVCVS